MKYMEVGTESRFERVEPNFDSWITEEERMHELRSQIVNRALGFGDKGWLFAEEFANYNYSKDREQGIVALATLIAQGYLAVDLDNPRILRVTAEGIAWSEAQQRDPTQSELESPN